MILASIFRMSSDTLFNNFVTFMKLIVYGFLPSLVFSILWIKIMKAKEFGQYIRELGPETHLKKQGIPTMGGVAFLFSSIMVCFMLSPVIDKLILFIIVSMLLFALVGFYDDFKKLKKKKNEGLTVKGKTLCLIIISIVLYILFLRGFHLRIPFTNIFIPSLIVGFLFLILLYSAVTNATNFTDGLDGLLTLVTLPISFFFAFLAEERGISSLFVFNLLFAGSLMGYYVLNKYPAMLFMGDLGSLAIGAYVVSNAIILEVYWYIPIFGIWYVIEVLSVIIQVLYFKKTGGKRFFKMAPYHHHLEKKGHSEKNIDKIAFSITFVATVISFLLIS